MEILLKYNNNFKQLFSIHINVYLFYCRSNLSFKKWGHDRKKKENTTWKYQVYAINCTRNNGFSYAFCN